MATTNIEIIKAGILSTVQDQGRPGLAYYAIPQSGAADLQSMQLANSLLGNNPDNPVIECTLMGIGLKFHQKCFFAICGSDFGWTLMDKEFRSTQ